MSLALLRLVPGWAWAIALALALAQALQSGAAAAPPKVPKVKKVDPNALSKILAGAKGTGHSSTNSAAHDSRRSSIKALAEAAKGVNATTDKSGGDGKFSTLGTKRRSVIRI